MTESPGEAGAPSRDPDEPGGAPSVCVLTGDETVVRSIISAFGEGCVTHAALERVVGRQNVLSQYGRSLVRDAYRHLAVLVEWRLLAAPIINTLGYHLRLEPGVPLVALCGRGDDEAVAALAAGCDAAVPLPVQPALVHGIALSHRRLVAAVRASTPASEPLVDPILPAVRTFGPLRIDRLSGRLYVHEQEVDLTPREYALLDFLMTTPDRLFSREEILMIVWGIDFDTGTNMVDVYMHFLRKKLEAHAASSMIQTVRGRGYRLTLPNAR